MLDPIFSKIHLLCKYFFKREFLALGFTPINLMQELFRTMIQVCLRPKFFPVISKEIIHMIAELSQLQRQIA